MHKPERTNEFTLTEEEQAFVFALRNPALRPSIERIVKRTQKGGRGL